MLLNLRLKKRIPYSMKCNEVWIMFLKWLTSIYKIEDEAVNKMYKTGKYDTK